MSLVTKSKKTVIKSFKLFDFKVYDEVASQNDGSDSGSDGDFKYKQYKDDKTFVIQMFGVNEKGETCCVYVDDYKPFFFVKVGDNWSEYDKRKFVDELKDKVGNKFKDSIISSHLVDYNKLYGFSGGRKHKFVKIIFQNSAAMNKVKNLWFIYDNETGNRKRVNIVSKKIQTELYESNIPPLLRYFHINNISPSGWVSFKLNRTVKPPTKTTTCNYEYIMSLKDLNPLPEKVVRVPYKICSFDIEASSSHGDFPVPIKTYKRFAINLVDVFIKQSAFLDNEMAKTLLKRCILTAFNYDKFDDVDLVYPKTPMLKSAVLKRVEILYNTPIKNAKDATDQDNSHILLIDTMFEEMRENLNSGGGDGEDVEYGEDNVPKYNYAKYKKKVRLDKKTTILDVIVGDKYDREEKIQLTNEVMTLLFPQLEGDKVTFIGSTFLKYGDTEPYLNNCIALGTCDNVPGVDIVSVKTESELLLKWVDLIQTENPDIMIGYNIFGFDYEFMFRRAQENDCERKFLKLSRKIDEICASEDKDRNLVIENTKMQIASGEYDLRYPKITGRLQIDMYAYFRRDFNLSSYKLDDVAGLYISDSIKKIVCSTHSQHGDVTELYSKNLTGLHIGDYIHIELGGVTIDYYKNGKKFHVMDIIQNKEVTDIVNGEEKVNTYNVIIIDGHEDITTNRSLKWGTAKDDVTPQDIFRLANGTSADRAIVAKYCVQDCNLVHHLMNKIDVITGYTEMASICSVPISFLIFRGQGIKLTSFVAKKCREKNTLMPDLEKTYKEEGYEGAIVLPPKCSMYMDNPVACVDYSSLYPSSMISQNYSHDSKVWTKTYDLDDKLIHITGERDKDGNFIYDNLPGYQYIDIDYDNFEYLRNPQNPLSRKVKTKVGRMTCRWAQLPDNQKSIMPSILEELLKARKDTRKMIKTEKDPFVQNILDKRQLGYKVTANSLYGQCGSRTSTFYEKDVAASTTATGRMMIIYGKRIIEEVYGNLIYETKSHGQVRCRAEYVYGDTDSVFFTFNLEHPETGEKITGKPALEMTIEIAQDAAILSSNYLKPPMYLEYEKTLMPFILLSKKRYVGMLYEEDPNKGYLKYMGLSIKRRDSCDYLKDVYGEILNILMKENDVGSAIKYLDYALNELIEGRVNMDKLAITKALRGDYKNPNQIGHKVLADRIGQRDPGNKPKPGDRMKFVFIVNNNPKALMGDKIETTEYIVDNNLQIDYTHYITNQLMKPLQQLFGLALEQIWTMQNKKSAIKTYHKEVAVLEKEHGHDFELFMKKKEKLSSARVKLLLFDKVLTKIYNKKNNIQTLNAFFVKK